MSENKEIEIGKNVSSGAEKVEKVAKNKKSKTTPSQKTVKKREKAETERAKARVEKAIHDKEEKAKKKAERKEQARKRAAERKALAEKRLAQQKALIERRAAKRKEMAEKRMEKRKALSKELTALREEQIRRRAHKKATKRQEKARALKAKKARTENNEQKQNARRSNQKGYGGWLAAVITLGVVTLALSSIVTVGAIDMTKKNGMMTSMHRANTYELVSIIENVDEDLDRARVSNSPVQQQRILTDLLVQARLAELDLEKTPVSAEKDVNFTTFINRVGAESERMLSKLRSGGYLDEKDQQSLEQMYQTTREVRIELDKFISQMCDKDITQFIKKGQGKYNDIVEGVEKLTMPENNVNVTDEKMEMNGAGMRSMDKNDDVDSGFTAKIQPSKAEELCQVYFADYPVKEYRCVGENTMKNGITYSIQGFDKDGTMLFAEIDATSGALCRFSYYKDCKEDNFDLQNAQMLAENFLEKMGYTQVETVRLFENGTDCDFTFVHTKDGVIYYPDMIKVKVCRTRGIVTGLDATSFLKNHRERKAPMVSISKETAQKKLHKNLQTEAVRLSVVKTMKGEKAAYEFVCSFEEERYLVYIDATTGEEISIVNVKNIG